MSFQHGFRPFVDGRDGILTRPSMTSGIRSPEPPDRDNGTDAPSVTIDALADVCALTFLATHCNPPRRVQRSHIGVHHIRRIKPHLYAYGIRAFVERQHYDGVFGRVIRFQHPDQDIRGLSVRPGDVRE